MANKLTDEQFYAQMDKIKQLSGFNPLDEIDALNAAEYGVKKPPTQQPVADTSILGLMERGEGVVGDFIGGLLGGPASNWRDNLQQDTNVNPYVAGKDVLNQSNVNFLDSAKTSLGGGADLVANPKQTVQSIADLSSGALQHALPDSMSWNEDDKAMASMAGQQIKEDWTTAEGFQKMLAERPAEVFPAFYGAGILGKIAGGKARDVLNSEAVLSKVEPMSRAIDPTNLGPSSQAVGKSKDMRDISPQYATLPYRVDELEKIKNLTTETTDNQLIDVPEVSIVDLEGKPFALGMADRTEAGKTLTTVNDIELNEGVPLRGGQNYMRNAENYIQGNVWASAPSAVSGIINHATKAKGDSKENPLFLPWSMQPTGNDFSHQTVEVMVNMADTVLNKTQKSKLNNQIKKIVPSWKGIGSSKLAEVLNNTTGAERKAMLKVLDRDFRDVGLSLPEARVAVSDVDQLNMPQSTLMNVGLLDLERSNFSNHPTYAQALKGDVVGRLKENISAFDLLDADNPFMVARGKNISGDNFDSDAVTSLRWKGGGGVITDKILRQLEDKGLLGQIDTPKKDNRSAVPEIKSQTPNYKSLEEQNSSTAPKVPVGNIFNNKSGVIPKEKRKAVDAMIDSGKETDIPYKTVSVADIVPTQKNVTIPNLEKVKDAKDITEDIIAVENGGKYYLVDGHHRVANDILGNKDTVEIRVLKDNKVDDGLLGQTLDMDETSRWSRAKEMGFDTDTIYYHGTTEHGLKKISEEGFKSGKGGISIGENIYLTPSKQYAAGYGSRFHNFTNKTLPEIGQMVGKDKRLVVPVFIKKGGITKTTFNGKEIEVKNPDDIQPIHSEFKPKKVKDGLLKQEPLTVYRSSTSGSYDKFDKSKQRTSTLGKGVYMFDNEKGANDWVGGNLQKIELPYDYMEKSINWGDGGQSDFVTKAFKKIEKEVDFKLDLEDGGIDVYPELVKKLDEDKAQALLSKHGIYGNRRDKELTIFNVDDAKIISTDKKKPKNGLLD